LLRERLSGYLVDTLAILEVEIFDVINTVGLCFFRKKKRIIWI
jgi:hypothetical protein